MSLKKFTKTLEKCLKVMDSEMCEVKEKLEECDHQIYEANHMMEGLIGMMSEDIIPLVYDFLEEEAEKK